jgi:hypothetical protein
LKLRIQKTKPNVKRFNTALLNLPCVATLFKQAAEKEVASIATQETIDKQN